MLADCVLHVTLDEIHLRDIRRRAERIELLEKSNRLRRGESRTSEQTIDIGKERVLSGDRALVYLPSRDERISIVPLVREQSAQKEKPFRIRAATACRSVQPTDCAEPNCLRTRRRLSVGGVDDI